jgi:hypothetical protein
MGVMIVEYCLYETDIFDEDIGAKANQVIVPDRNSFTIKKVYKLTVKFHVNLLHDRRFEQIEIPASKTSKGTREDKISDLLSFQLDKVEQVLKSHDIEIYSMSIEGDYLDSENMIILELQEDTSIPSFIGRGKNKKRMKAKFIMPSRPYTQEKASQLSAERLGRIYGDLMNVIRDKKIMSEILEIEPTEDDKMLAGAFVKQYGELWLTTSEREKELLQQLEEKVINVLNSYY